MVNDRTPSWRQNTDTKMKLISGFLTGMVKRPDRINDPSLFKKDASMAMREAICIEHAALEESKKAAIAELEESKKASLEESKKAAEERNKKQKAVSAARLVNSC